MEREYNFLTQLTKNDVISYTLEDRKILKYLFLKPIPEKFRPEVFFNNSVLAYSKWS